MPPPHPRISIKIYSHRPGRKVGGNELDDHFLSPDWPRATLRKILAKNSAITMSAH